MLQVGVHGAGLINHNFMKPNSSFVEIMPCKFGGEWPSQYFQAPAEKERITFYWRLQAHKRKHCHASPLQTGKRRNHPGKATSMKQIAAVLQIAADPYHHPSKLLCTHAISRSMPHLSRKRLLKSLSSHISGLRGCKAHLAFHCCILLLCWQASKRKEKFTLSAVITGAS